MSDEWTVPDLPDPPAPPPEPDRVAAPNGKFGPTFWAELVAAGADTLPMVVGADYILFAPSISAADRKKVMTLAKKNNPEAVIPAPVTVLYKVDFYRRMTDEEAEAVEDEIAKQPVKQRRIFESANSFRSDAPEWQTLNALAGALFGAARAKVILAPSEAQ